MIFFLDINVASTFILKDIGGYLMEYTIKQLSSLAGITTRTIRYYDNIGLLKPKRINHSGYRLYGSDEVDLLQQILFFRALDMSLEDIKTLIMNPEYDCIKALEEHQNKLLQQQKYIENLLDSISQTIDNKKKGIEMKDNQKFQALKNKNIRENEAQFGQEIRKKYGDKIIDDSNRKYENMSEKNFDYAQELSKRIFSQLYRAMDIKDLSSKEAQKVVKLHKEWLMIYWTDYSTVAHRQLADTYVSDLRFKNFYDKERNGTAEFLRDAIYHYTSV